MERLLLIIDMQEGFRYKNAENIIPNVIKAAKSFDGGVAFALFRDRKGSEFDRRLHWRKFESKENRKLLRELSAIKARRFWHSGYTVLNSALLGFIRRSGVKTLCLAGVYTDVCIAKAAMDAFDSGISVKILGGACASQDGSRSNLYLTLRSGKSHTL